MLNVDKCLVLGNGISDIDILNYEVEASVVDGKINVDNVLSLENISLVKEFLDSIGFENYYDFYFLQLKDFKDILDENQNIKVFFNRTVGKEHFRNYYTGNRQLLLFAERIGYKKLNVDKLKEGILSDFADEGISSLNEFNVFGLNNLKISFKKNSALKYYIYRKFTKSFLNLTDEEYLKLGKLLGLELLEEQELKIRLKERFKDIGIEYLEDLEKINVRDFKSIADTDLLFKSYISLKNKFKSDIRYEDREQFGIDIGLINKYTHDYGSVKNFLKGKHIISYCDLHSFGINDVRSILWENSACKNILNGLGLEYSKDFRISHLKKFARLVGFTDVPNDIEYTETDGIKVMKEYLFKNGIDCMYSLKLKGVKFLRNLFKEKNIGKLEYKKVSVFMKNNFNITMISLKTENLDKLGELLGLSELSDEEYKDKLILFLNEEGIELNKLSKNKVKVNYWSNIYIRYFLEKQGITDVKKLRAVHMDGMKKYLENI